MIFLIVIYGAGACGYAAAAFSVAAPGANVVALHPQATLDRLCAGWDTRYRAFRHLDFTGRYGYAPDMIEGAKRAAIVYDPWEHLDAAHAAQFAKQHVDLLPCPLLGGNLSLTFDRLGILDVMLKLAMSDALTSARFTQLLRARRYDDTYAKSLISHLKMHAHPKLANTIRSYKSLRSTDPFYGQPDDTIKGEADD